MNEGPELLPPPPKNQEKSTVLALPVSLDAPKQAAMRNALNNFAGHELQLSFSSGKNGETLVGGIPGDIAVEYITVDQNGQFPSKYMQILGKMYPSGHPITAAAAPHLKAMFDENPVIMVRREKIPVDLKTLLEEHRDRFYKENSFLGKIVLAHLLGKIQNGQPLPAYVTDEERMSLENIFRTSGNMLDFYTLGENEVVKEDVSDLNFHSDKEIWRYTLRLWLDEISQSSSCVGLGLLLSTPFMAVAVEVIKSQIGGELGRAITDIGAHSYGEVIDMMALNAEKVWDAVKGKLTEPKVDGLGKPKEYGLEAFTYTTLPWRVRKKLITTAVPADDSGNIIGEWPDEEQTTQLLEQPELALILDQLPPQVEKKLEEIVEGDQKIVSDTMVRGAALGASLASLAGLEAATEDGSLMPINIASGSNTSIITLAELFLDARDIYRSPTLTPELQAEQLLSVPNNQLVDKLGHLSPDNRMRKMACSVIYAARALNMNPPAVGNLLGGWFATLVSLAYEVTAENLKLDPVARSVGRSIMIAGGGVGIQPAAAMLYTGWRRRSGTFDRYITELERIGHANGRLTSYSYPQ